MNIHSPTIGIGTYNSYGRLVSKDRSVNFGVGLKAFSGIEYFFMPKMSIGADIGFTTFFRMEKTSYEIRERLETQTMSIGTTEIKRADSMNDIYIDFNYVPQFSLNIQTYF